MQAHARTSFQIFLQALRDGDGHLSQFFAKVWRVNISESWSCKAKCKVWGLVTGSQLSLLVLECGKGEDTEGRTIGGFQVSGMCRNDSLL